MNLREFKKMVKAYLGTKDIEFSKTAINEISSGPYVNRRALKEMSNTRVRKAVRGVLDDSIKEYEQRQKKSSRKVVMRDIDVKPALKKKFCSLPPFCKGNTK